MTYLLIAFCLFFLLSIMNIPLVLLWAFMFAWQHNNLSTKLEKTIALVHDTRHGLHEVEVAHNLTRDTLSSTKDRLGSCASEVSLLQAKLKISESQNEVKGSTILALEELVRTLRLDSDKKSNDLLEFHNLLDRILCCIVWVAPILVLLIVILLVTFSNILNLFIFCRLLLFIFYFSSGCCDQHNLHHRSYQLPLHLKFLIQSSLYHINLINSERFPFGIFQLR